MTIRRVLLGSGTLLIAVSCLAVLAGCGHADLPKRLVPKEADAFARDYVDLLRKKEFEQVTRLFVPQLRSPETASSLEQMAGLLDQGEPISMELVGWMVNVNVTTHQKTSDLTYQIQFKDAWVLANVVLEQLEGPPQILGSHVTPLPKSLRELNAFSFSGRSFKHWAILLLAFGVPALSVYALVSCMRSKIRRKWLWLAFIAAGVGAVTLNWTTGQLGLQPISVQLLGASLFRNGL